MSSRNTSKEIGNVRVSIAFESKNNSVNGLKFC